ncbi:OLC1v1038331C1 [Oldenlandia corymbosa var. corymbosa]|uniref:OLC1v1038331C1 n=1 Tax=Oldenlandia corymbosa var. corymbosa TaxID=529605 RepID=A0AAV1D1U2_OLDCO|nr:OLC1v1038331C1 [Oldenlandia corymbosa var. corymbosa]
MQQTPPMIPVMPSFPPANITTEQIQKYLDENKKLILAILDNQNLGKLAECAQYQAQLQKNLMYLAAIADAQPQTPAMPPQMTPHPAMQPGGFYMQHPQAAAAAMAQQPGPGGMFPPRMPLQYTNPLAMPDHQQQQQLHQQAMQGQIVIRPGGGPSNGMHAMHSESAAPSGMGGSGGGPPASSGQSDRGKQDGAASEVGASGVDMQQRSSATGQTGGDPSEEAK